MADPASPADTNTCWTLIHTLFDWAPGPRSARSQALPGFRHGPREQACEDCLANGKTMPGCETCGGRGTIHVPAGRDPYEKQATGFYAASQDAKERAHRRDVELLRLAQQLGGEEHAPDDSLTRALEQRDRQYANGDYAQLERALQEFRDRFPALHGTLWRIEVCHEPIVASPVIRQALDEAVARLIAPRMVELVGGRRLRAPAWLRRDEGAARRALRHGRSWQHQRARGQRNEEIRRLYAEGWKVSRLGREFDLSRSQVYEILGAAQAVAGTAA